VQRFLSPRRRTVLASVALLSVGCGGKSSTAVDAYQHDIDLWFTSRVIPAGDRLRVTVASAGFPKYDRTLNTGGDNQRDTKYVTARQRILHDAAHRSFVRLPVIPRGKMRPLCRWASSGRSPSTDSRRRWEVGPFWMVRLSLIERGYRNEQLRRAVKVS
jgi:hypothetical protein